MPELLHHIGAVDPGSLILLSGNILQNTGNLHHGIGNTDPQVNDDDHGSCPGNIGKEGQILCLCQEAPLPQQVVHRTVIFEHGADNQQGDKLGNRNGQTQDRPPQALEAGGGTVDDHCHNGAGKEVQEGCEEGPDQRPAQNRHELLTDGGFCVKQRREVLQAHPIKEDQMLIHLGVVGEGHQDHIEQRNDREDDQNNKRRCHQQLVDVAIQQCFAVILKRRLLELQGCVAAADRCPPDHDACHQDSQGRHSVEQDLLRVIALGVDVNTLVGIPYLTGLQLAQTGQHTQPVEATLGKYHIYDDCCLDQQEQQALDQLACHDIAKTHDQAGKPDHRSAVFQCARQRGRIGFSLTGCCGFCQFFR